MKNSCEKSKKSGIPFGGTLYSQRGNDSSPTWEQTVPKLGICAFKSLLPHHHAKGALGIGTHSLYLIVVLFVLGSLQESVETVFGLVALL